MLNWYDSMTWVLVSVYSHKYYSLIQSGWRDPHCMNRTFLVSISVSDSRLHRIVVEKKGITRTKSLTSSTFVNYEVRLNI